MSETNVSSVDRIQKCPICGGKLDEGYVVVSRTLWWDNEKHAFLRRQKLLSKHPAWTNTNFPALRCWTCHIIIFDPEKRE